MADSSLVAQAGQASLWTMTVSVRAAPLAEAKLDLRVSREQIQRKRSGVGLRQTS